MSKQLFKVAGPVFTAALLGGFFAWAGDGLEQGFAEPPDSAKAQTWWHWMDGQVSLPGITAELEAIRAMGLGGVHLFMAGKGPTPTNETPCLSPKWKEAVRHAVSECERLGLALTAQNCAGWSGAGGPWITPDKAMFLVETREERVAGGQTVTMPAPPSWPEKGDTFYRDIAILAFPTPPAVREAGALPEPVITASRPVEGLGRLNRKTVSRDLYRKDKEADTVRLEADENRTDWIQLAFPEPVTVRALTLASSGGCIEPDAHKPLVQASPDGETFTNVVQLATYACMYNCELEDVTHALPTTRAKVFRLVWSGPHKVRLTRAAFQSLPALTGLKGLTGEAGRTFVNEPALPHEPDSCLDTQKLADITGTKDDKGQLVWTAPAGDWTVLRVGYRNKRRQNMPAPREASGLECDKFDPEVVSFHFDQYMGLILKEAEACGAKSVKGLLLDSWEAETQNWTHRFPQEFRKRRGYDITPWLPAYAGHIVGNRDQTCRFLRDARQTGNDLLVENFFDVLARRAHERGLAFYSESVGGSGAGTMVADAVEHYFHVDIPMTEAGRPMREAVSAAHLTGRPVVAMEAHTSRAAWEQTPRMLKNDEDSFFSEGISRIVFHTYAHNATPERLYPGPAFWSYGVPFSRGQTWWASGKEWIRYLGRCQFLLQQGLAVADVLACTGEETLGPLVQVYARKGGSAFSDELRGLPEGYEYDLLPASFLIRSLEVNSDGTLSGPGGTVYRLIVLYPSDRLTPELLRKIRSLVAGGATVLGPRPAASVSLSGYPACDEEVRRLAAELWGGCDGAAVREHAFAKGRVLCGMTLGEALERLGVPPDFRARTRDANASVSYVHRRTRGADIYFVRRVSGDADPKEDRLGFRVAGKVPELWDPVSGERRMATAYVQESGMTWIPYEMTEPGSTQFVIFRQPTAEPCGATERNLPVYEKVKELKGPWSLSFKGLDAPERMEVLQLADLSKSDREGVRYFSGTIIYAQSFEWECPVPPGVRLGLGDVCATAEVFLNGKACGVAWTRPCQVDISKALQPGKNAVEIRVANTWANRLIGDLKRPEELRKTWTTYAGYDADADVAKFPSGLMGPVTVLAPAEPK